MVCSFFITKVDFKRFYIVKVEMQILDKCKYEERQVWINDQLMQSHTQFTDKRDINSKHNYFSYSFTIK